jgi:hypothetical protein
VRRRWLTYPLFALLVLALLPFLALCLVLCLKLFLAAAILGFVALTLISAALLLYAVFWLLANAGRRRAKPPLSDTSA